MSACTRCSEIARSACAMPREADCVLVYAPAPPAMRKVRLAATSVGYQAEELADAVYLLTREAADWPALLTALEGHLSAMEAEETRLAPIGGLSSTGHAVTLAALKARALPTLLGELRDTWLPWVLDAKTITSHFQPIVDLESGSIFAYEALLRATREDGVLANGGAIVAAGRRMGALHVLDQVGRTSAIHRAHQIGLTSALFINFFPTVVYDPAHCLRTTRQAMRETGMSPEQIVFEVVESEQIADRAHLLDILAYYRAEGFRVALDDLGSGYSSLNLLAALRPDFVKLDMELVRGVDVDPLHRSLVQALVSTAHENGIQVIAEGVETVESAAVLAELGVQLLQGYLFGRPAPTAATVPADIMRTVQRARRG